MRKNYAIVWLLLLATITAGHAQRIVRGTVQAASNKTELPGVTVLLKGTETGAATDMNGNFQLVSLRDTITLVFASVGFERLEKKVFIT